MRTSTRLIFTRMQKVDKKPVVHYRPTENDAIEVGVRAIIYNVVDHPSSMVSNRPGVAVFTSNVLKKKGRRFETENTRYVPIKDVK